MGNLVVADNVIVEQHVHVLVLKDSNIARFLVSTLSNLNSSIAETIN